MFHMGSDGYGWMMGWGFGHWLMFALMAALVIYPVGLILRRLGFSPLWSILAFVPGVNIVGLWVVALTSTESSQRETR